MTSSRFNHLSTFCCRCNKSYISSFYLQDDVNVYRSSPPLPGIYRPFFLVPSAHAQPLPYSEDSLEIEGFSSDSETYNAEAGEAAGDYNGGSAQPQPERGYPS